MSIELTVGQLRLIVTRVVKKKFGMTLDEYIHLLEKGVDTESPHLEAMVRLLPEAKERLGVARASGPG